MPRDNRLRHYSKVMTPIFHDNCNVARKYTNKSKQTALFPISKLPLVSCRTPITKPYFALFENDTTDSSTNYWIEDSMNHIIESGNQNTLIENPINQAIDDKGIIATIERVSDELRLREFISRQITGIGTVPKKVQATFCMGAAIVLSENIVSPEVWREIGPKICQEMGWSIKVATKYKYFVAETARRFGKTRFITMTAVNFATSRPGSTIIVFSTSQDASDLLRTDVENMMAEAGEIEYAGKLYNVADLKGRGQKKIRITSPYDPTRPSTIYFKPGLNPANMDKQVCFNDFFIFEKKRTIDRKVCFIVFFESFR